MMSGLYGNIIKVIADRVLELLETYYDIIKNGVTSTTFFITAVIQIPYDNHLFQDREEV